LSREKRQHPVLYPRPFLHKILALAVNAFAVLLVGRGHPDHAADLTVASEVGSEHTQKSLGIDAIGLRPLRSSVHKDAGRLDDIGPPRVTSNSPG